MRDSADGTPVPTEELGAPAGRALDGAGITTLEQVAEPPERTSKRYTASGPVRSKPSARRYRSTTCRFGRTTEGGRRT